MLSIQINTMAMLLSEFDFLPIYRADLAGSRTLSFKSIKYISTIYIMTTTCTYLQQLTQVSDVAHGPLVFIFLHRRSVLDRKVDRNI